MNARKPMVQSACRLAGLSSRIPSFPLNYWECNYIRRLIPGHRRRNGGADRVDSPAHRIGIEVGIARRRRGLRMTEQLADDGKSERSASAEAGERMPEVVNANSFETG